MENKTETKSPARGGLAAEVAAAKKKLTPAAQENDTDNATDTVAEDAKAAKAEAKAQEKAEKEAAKTAAAEAKALAKAEKEAQATANAKKKADKKAAEKAERDAAKTAAKAAKDVPFVCEPRKEQKVCREGTVRGKFLAALKVGATIAALEKIGGKDQAEGLIKNAGVWYGYGIKREGEIITAYVN